KFSKDGVEAQPGNVPYYPRLPQAQPIDSAIFADAERMEFQAGDLQGAASALSQIAANRDARVRNEALLRLARVYSKSGLLDQSLEAYSKLSQEMTISAAEAPYALVSRFARCELLANSHQEPAARKEAGELVADLESGKFLVTKESYVWYDAQLRK